MSNVAEGDEEEARLEEEQETKLAEMEAEMEKEKEARKLAGATEEEIQKALELLQRQHDAKRKVKCSAFVPVSSCFPTIISTYATATDHKLSAVFPSKLRRVAQSLNCFSCFPAILCKFVATSRRFPGIMRGHRYRLQLFTRQNCATFLEALSSFPAIMYDFVAVSRRYLAIRSGNHYSLRVVFRYNVRIRVSF